MTMRTRNVQVPGAGVQPPADVDNATAPADAVASEATPAASAPADRDSQQYWRDKPAAEAQAYWESLPAHRKTTAFNVLCLDGWYCAPFVDPRLAAGVRGV